MKKYTKCFAVLLMCIVLAACLSVESFAFIDCDGVINVYEWEECEQTILFDDAGKSGNAYHSLCVKHKYIEEDRRVYLGILMEILNSELNKTPENTANKIYLSFNNSSEIVISSDLTAEYNDDEFSLNFGYREDDFGGCIYEVECVLKALEYDEILDLNISVRDFNGKMSQIYQINIKSEEQKEEESVSAAESEKASEKESEKASRKAAKEKATQKSSSKTTKARTTKPKETTTEFVTAIITEEYKAYSETVKDNNRATIIIGVACVVTSVAAMCVALFKKENAKK